MQHKVLAILQMGDPPLDIQQKLGVQSDWVIAALPETSITVKVLYPASGDTLPEPHLLAGAILTGSTSMVTDREPWSEYTADWIRLAIEQQLPLLGICYGHQLIAHALGGVVDYHPAGREIGQLPIQLHDGAQNDPLLAGLPPTFMANLTHEQSVLQPPEQATILASSEHDAHQILRYSPYALSLQFHPEFSTEVMSYFLSRREALFSTEGYDIPAMCAALGSTPVARKILHDFVELCATTPAVSNIGAAVNAN
ncbi:glutamine amidotransferase [Paenalcaligenes sp. Me131]|uniref:glutamine amidotransferase n=1 Tax=Paenalcaligenes sp. Me131 TaxID=3392636 RepID=UPI003D2BFCCA